MGYGVRGYREDISRTAAFSRLYIQNEDLCAFKEICNSDIAVVIDVEKSAQKEISYMDAVGEKILLSLASNLEEEGEEVFYFNGDRFLIIVKSSLCVHSLKERTEKILFSFKLSHSYMQYCVSFFMHDAALKISLSKKGSAH